MSWLQGRSAPYGSNEEHLRDELARVAYFLRAQLVRFRLARPEAHRERFWHLTDDYLDTLANDEDLSPLDSFEPPDDARPLLERVAERRSEIDKRLAATKRVELRLPRLAREFELQAEDVDALLVALLPTLHSTYRDLFGVLQHDPARSQATIGIIVEMLSASADDSARLHARLGSTGTLARERLIALTGNDDAPVTRSIVVDERIVTFLLGSDAPDARVASVARMFDEPVELRTLPLAPETKSRLEMLPNLRAAEPDLMPRLRLNLVGPDPDLAMRAFATVVQEMQRRLLVVDVEAAVASGVGWPLVIELALRDARLVGGIPLFTGLARLQESPEQAYRYESLMNCLAAFPHPAAIETGAALETGARAGDWIPFQLPAPSVAMRESLWRQLLVAEPNNVDDPDALAPALARSFQLTGSQIREAWRTAQGFARHRNVFVATVESQDLYAACRKQSATKLVAFAQRLEPRPRLNLGDDIVLPPASTALLRELRTRIRHHARVHAEMGLGDHMRLGRGVTALFVGGSGTGKTMAAEVLASEEHLDLYCIDLASLVSKWVGETEKNLSRVFADAERANCMLFFDEADALFGRRGAVKDAQDRWANLEVNFLLQRIEEYSGVVILATNLRQNMDDAFQRRIHVIVEFPVPDAASRRAIWERLLPGGAKRAVSREDIDEVSQRFELTGGSIRNVVLDACFRALADGEARPLTTRHLVASAAREYQKLARPVTRGDFGRFYDWAMEDVIAPPAVAVAGSA
jgi:hypothetical protein